MLYAQDEADPEAVTATAVNFKVYIGADIGTSEAYFHAEMSKTTFQNLVSATGSKRKLPKGFGESELSGFNGTDVAYISFATKATTVTATTPPLQIAQGLSMSGSIKYYGYPVGVFLNIDVKGNTYKADLQLPGMSFWGLDSYRTKADAAVKSKTNGPIMGFSLSPTGFSGYYKGYMKFGQIAEASVDGKITSTSMVLHASVQFFKWNIGAKISVELSMEDTQSGAQASASSLVEQGYEHPDVNFNPNLRDPEMRMLDVMSQARQGVSAVNGFSLTVSIDVAGIQKGLQDLIEKALGGLKATQAWAQKKLKALNDKVQAAHEEVTAAQKLIDDRRAAYYKVSHYKSFVRIVRVSEICISLR